MKKRVLSLFLALTLCLTLLPTAAFAEGMNGSAISGEAAAAEGGQPTATGAPTEGGGQLTNTGEGEQPNSETDTRTEIWCVSRPDSIGRSYDGTTDGSTIPINLTFTDGTNSYTLTEKTDFTATKTFDSADAGDHTVTVEIKLIDEAAKKYKLKAGEETFAIGGTINKAYPDLTVSLSKTTCTVGEKLLPLLSAEGAPEGAAVTYYYTQFQSIAGYSEYEDNGVIPKIDKNTAVSSLDEEGNNTYYIYAKTGETRNYNEDISNVVELTVNEAAVEAASITRADGTDGGTYKSLPAALNAARDGDTVKLLANHVTDADTLNTLGEDFTFEQYASIVPVVTKTLTLDLNHKTVDYLEVGFSETNEETQEKETLATGNLTVISEAAYGRILNLLFMAGALDIQSGEIGGSECVGLVCDVNSGTATISNGMVYGLTVLEGASVAVNGGSNHAGEWVVASGATLNITDGTFGDVQFTRNGTIAISGGTFKSIKSYIAEKLQPLMSLLDTQKVHAFYKGDDVQDGNATELADVTVKEHTHTMADNKCACGFSCTHKDTDGTSAIGKDGKCTVCGTQFAAGIGEIYYTDVPSALDAARDGDTVQLLANGMLPDGIYVSKTLTLDLNGHSLGGYSLHVGGLTVTGQVRTGKLTVVDSSGGNGAVGVAVRDGGTLVFDPENGHTTLLRLEVWGGTVKLNGGKILRSGLQLNNNITLGDLLPGKAGLAYYRGDTQLTLAEAASQTCDLVVKSCSHGGKNGFDNNSTNCPYCNAPAVAETALNNGEGSRLLRRFADLQTAIDADRAGGSEFTLLADVTGDYTIDGTQDTGLDLNGHSIKGTVTVKGIKGDFITTTLSNTQNTTTASIDKVVAFDGAELAGSRYPAVIGKLTLAEGATWKNILNLKTLGYKVLNADGTHKWYAPDDVNGSQLNNVIINSLPITSKTLNLKVNGKNLTGSSPKVERGTTVQLCASCNTSGATVTFSILKKGETTPITLTEPSYAGGKYTKDYSFDTIGEYTIYFTAAKDGYTVQSAEKKLTVTKAAIPASAITAPAANALTYNGKEQKLITEGSVDAKYGEMQYRLGTSGGFSTAIPTAADAGTYTVYYKVVGAEGYNDTTAKSIKVTVSPVKIKGIGNVTSVSKTYDGSASVALPKTNLAFLDAAGNMISLPESAYTITDARFTTRQDDLIYKDSPDAGTKETISFTLTLTDPNYVFEGEAANVRSDNFNFTSDDDRFKIDQATVTPDEITLFVYNDVAKTYTLDLATLLPELTSGCEYGKIKYQGRDYHFTDSTYLDSNNDMSVSNEGILTLPIVAAHSTDVNKQIGTITAPVVTVNYQQFELTIKVVIGEKITPVKSDDFKISATGIIYRQTLENSTLTVKGTMKDPTTGEEVKGTFAWKNKYDLPINTGDVYFDWTFTPAEGYEEYAAVTDIVKVPVSPKSIEGAAITLEKYEFAYNAAEQSPKITGVTLENWDETRITYVIKSGGSATNASDSITLTIEGTGNYTGKATVEWKITPKTVTPTIEVASCTYTGDALEPDVTLKDGDAFIPEGEYTAEYSNNTNAGTGRVTITNKDGGNYVIQGSTQDFPINKAAAPTNIQDGSLNVINGTQLTYTYDFAQLLPAVPHGDYGTVRYDLGKRQTAINFTAYGYYIDPEIAEFEGSKLTLVGLYAKDGTATGQIGTVKVKVTTTNYEDFSLTLVLNAVNRITPVADGSITASKITYGQTLSESRISGTMRDPTTGATVNGTFTWTDGTINPNAGGYEAEWTFTPAAGYEKYATATGTVTIKVNKATPTFTPPTAQENLTYTGREQELIIAGSVDAQYGEMQYRLGTSGSFSTASPNGTDAGTYTVWYRVIGDANHNDTVPASVVVRIGQKPLPLTGGTAVSKSYDGTTNADISSVTFDGVTLNRGTDYTAAASFDDASVGNGKNVTATVTLMGQAAKNYALEQSSFTTTGNITKAAAPDFIKETTLTIVNDCEKTYTVTLPALPTLETPKEYGALTYEIGEIKLNDGYYTSGAKVENGELTLPIQKNDVETTGSVGTVTVVIKSANYEDITLTVNVSAKNKLSPVLAGTLTLTPIKITYGEPLSKIKITGTMKAGDTVVEGTFSWQQPDDTILDASTPGHDIGWKFTPKDGNAYTEATGIATVKVDKAQQYGKVSMEFYSYGETPSTPSLTDRTGDGSVTYYYNTTNSNSGGTKWENIQPDTLRAGTCYYMYAELGETKNYDSFTTACKKFWVMKVIPTCTKPTGLTAKYGQKLSQIALTNPEGNTPGTWRWQEPETVLDQLGTRSFYADFKPDNENYSEVLNVAIDVTVGPADGGSLKTVELTQKYTDASVHTYTPDWSGLPDGQTWSYNSEYSVSTGSNVTLTRRDLAADGSLLTYAISGGKAGDKITLTLKASCDNYEDYTITLTITLREKDSQEALVIAGNTTVVYGQTLTLTTSGGSGTGAVTYRIDTAHSSTGEAAIDPNTGVLTPVRVGSVSVIAAKAGDNDYNDVTSAPFVLMVKPATPTGAPKYTEITTGGKTLRDAALTIEGSTLNPKDGKLEWLDDKGNALPDDTRVKVNTTYKWRFTPTDTNYTTLTGEIELLHHKSNGGDSSGYSYYTIEATAGAGGAISPSGSVSVREGRDQTFTITPDKGYAVSNVKIDGKSIGAVKSYTFENVSRTHTIEVIFVKGAASASTGDSSNLPLWSALLLASTLTLAGAVRYKRKRAR